MQNKAKIVIPIVILFIVIVAIVICPRSIFIQWEPKPIEKVETNNLKLKVYIENSGSMNGYMQ